MELFSVLSQPFGDWGGACGVEKTSHCLGARGAWIFTQYCNDIHTVMTFSMLLFLLF